MTSRSAWFLPRKGPPRAYPGAVINVPDIDEFTNVSDAYCKTQHVLPPGVPLDEDLINDLLQLLVLHQGWKGQTSNFTVFNITKYAEAREAMETTLDLIYMEAIWRQINKKK